MIWILFAIVTAGVILAVARPLGRAAAPGSGKVSEIEAYRLQLAELARDEELGKIGKEEAEQTRTEISRRLLRASRQSSATAVTGQAVFNTNIAFLALAGFIAIGAVGLYAIYGTPSLPDQPLEARLDAPPSEQSLGIQIVKEESRLRANPDDAAGWASIAPEYFRTAQFDKAAHAYRKAISLGGQDEDKLLGLFEALTFGNDGSIPAEARPMLETALAKNPQSLRGRFWLAVQAIQDGKKDSAEQIYREMLGENIPGAWKSLIYKQLAALNEESEGQGKENGQPSGNAAEGGQSAMIGGMVQRLEGRLKENGADLNGWLMLIRSYAVLKEPGKALDAVASARKQFESEPQALEKIDVLVREAGLAPAEGGAQASVNAPEGGQEAMIRGMVDRLAARLKENGADLDGWLKLIRSYAVLNETGKAQDAAASARKQFASERQALERIETLMRELHIQAADGNGEQPKL